MLFYLVSYPLLGAGIKFIDEAFDEKRYSKTLAIAIAPLLGILWAWAMMSNPASASILLAVLAGVFFTGKIDNWAHLAGLGVIIIALVLLGVQLLIIPLIVLAAAALLDELGNDFVDKHKQHWNTNKIGFKALVYFFDHRWMLKTALLPLALFGLVPWYFVVAMMLFDEAYLLVRWYSDIRFSQPHPVLFSDRTWKGKSDASLLSS